MSQVLIIVLFRLLRILRMVIAFGLQHPLTVYGPGPVSGILRMLRFLLSPQQTPLRTDGARRNRNRPAKNGERGSCPLRQKKLVSEKVTILLPSAFCVLLPGFVSELRSCWPCPWTAAVTAPGKLPHHFSSGAVNGGRERVPKLLCFPFSSLSLLFESLDPISKRRKGKQLVNKTEKRKGKTQHRHRHRRSRQIWGFFFEREKERR